MESILDTFKIACIEISDLMRNSDPFKLSEITDNHNESGDDVKSLDILSNDILKTHLSNNEFVSVIGSEEEEDLCFTKYNDKDNYDNKYMVCFDPLDGSSNIDSNITVGTIFAIYKLPQFVSCYQDLVDTNVNIVAAGYCLYGSSTQFVQATNKVDMFLLQNNKFNLICDNFNMKDSGKIYSINESNRVDWIGNCTQQIIDTFIVKGYSARWVGSMVTDCHRTLIKGGLFAYPGNKKNQDGKIRLLYEAYPFAYIFKIAGGSSFNGMKNILDVPFPSKLHQKTPIYLGGNEEMNMLINITMRY
jgi:fructose-1,6-bisphosphatase I